MQIIISCAKQIKMKDDYYFEKTQPYFQKQVNDLLKVMQNMDVSTLKIILKCSDTIANKAYKDYQNFHKTHGTPSLLAYSGLQYQYMAPDVFTDAAMFHAQDHLWILSALYGALRPFDAIHPYRLEMQTKPGFSLYDFWKDAIANRIPHEPLLNLASKEYAKVIRPYRSMIDVRFCQKKNGRFIEKGVYVKMARGAMVRYICENQIDDPNQIKSFNDLNYTYSPKDSTKNQYLFVHDK